MASTLESLQGPLPVDATNSISFTNSDPPPARKTPKPKTWRGQLGKSALMTVRRVHLYSGIFMFPFVLLYGFTGWFFNHPNLFNGAQATTQATTFAAADVANGKLTQLPTAKETAESIVAEMNIVSTKRNGPEVELTDSMSPHFKGVLSYTVKANKQSHQISINPVTGNGEIRSSVIEVKTAEKKAAEKKMAEKPINPLATLRRVELRRNANLVAKEAIPDVLDEMGLPSAEAQTGKQSASLLFSVKADGVPCLVTYSLANGAIQSVPEGPRPILGTKSFLQRLHRARRYSAGFDIRWVWALLVDAMFVSMVFWGCSGLMMWWQIKRTRLVGGGVLLASMIFAGVMAMGMHEEMTAAPTPGGGGKKAMQRAEAIAAELPDD